MLSSGEVAMGCNIHDWMSGFALVVDTPYFSKTDAKGEVTFSVESLGEYRLVVWHPQLDLDDNRFARQLLINQENITKSLVVTLPKKLKQIPLQENHEEFEFLEEY